MRKAEVNRLTGIRILPSAWSGCILAVILAAAAQTSPVPAREFRVADNQSADYPTVQAVVFMGRLIEAQTQGRHSIRVFHSRQTGPGDA